MFGSSPTLVIGAANTPVVIGNNGTGANAFGVILGGSIAANGVFDSTTVPSGPISVTAVQIGGQTGGSVDLQGGLSIVGAVSTAIPASGSIAASTTTTSAG